MVDQGAVATEVGKIPGTASVMMMRKNTGTATYRSYRKTHHTTSLVKEISDINCQRGVNHTVDGSEIVHQLRLVVYPIIYRVLYIPGGAGFIPSTVVLVSLCCSHSKAIPGIVLQKFQLPEKKTEVSIQMHLPHQLSTILRKIQVACTK